MPLIDSSDVPDFIKANPDLCLLDVRLEDDYQAEHPPGAVNNCVFEVSFLPKLSELGLTDLEQPVCVYGSQEKSFEARMAAEKLVRAGYLKVLEYRAGIEGWKSSGFPIESNRDEEAGSDVTPLHDGRHPLDLEESRVEWVGRNLLNKHWGTIEIRQGHLEIQDGCLVGGEVVVDMRKIRCDDLDGNPLHHILIDHLESDDFFDVEKYGEARLDITKASEVSKHSGERNLEVFGNLSMKGVTHPVQFAAAAGRTEGGGMAAQALLSIDRTKWNVLYGSGKYFSRLAGHLVNDHIDLQLRVVTGKSA